MSGVNKVILIGHAARPADVKISNNLKIANFSIATSIKSKNGEQTEWHSITAFDKLADVAENYIIKGSQIYVEGRIKTDKYVNKAGQDVERKSIVATSLQLLGKKEQTAPVEAFQSSDLVINSEVEEEDGIPF